MSVSITFTEKWSVPNPVTLLRHLQVTFALLLQLIDSFLFLLDEAIAYREVIVVASGSDERSDVQKNAFGAN